MHMQVQVRSWIVFLLILLLGLAISWQIALAQPPTPNPSSEAKDIDVTVPGAPASIHGYPQNGRIIFAQRCAPCHGDRGVGGIPNPGSDDGEVPAINPIDPAFLDDSQEEPAALAADLDPFLEHGSIPSGPKPAIVMPAWGDQKILTPDQIADVEAYVMQLNNVTWADRWYPPAEVRMTAAQSGKIVTYTITLVNQGGAPLDNVLLRDTLPAGLAYLQSGLPGMGSNPAQVMGNTVQWMNGGVEVGGTLGPFIVVTALTGATVPPNTAQVLFDYVDAGGDVVPASAVSDAVVPYVPPTPTPVPPPTVPPTSTPTAAPTSTPTASPTTVAAAPTVTATAGSAVPTSTPVPPTPTPAPTQPPPTQTAAPIQFKRPSNPGGPGPALQLQGNATNGTQVFNTYCQGCHGAEGKVGIANPGSDAGTVPALSPVEKALYSPDRTVLAQNVDLFIEHGSNPPGPSPKLQMVAWGDNKILTAQQIADVIAYILSLNP